MNIDTLCIHGADGVRDHTGSVTVPIYQAATFAHPGVGRSTGYDYSRLQNPTREHLEALVAKLEHGTDAIAFSTGMAAENALMELFQPGDHLIVSDDLYGGSHRLFHHVNEKNGILFDTVNTTHTEQIALHIKPRTKAVFIETPTNPMMQVTDITAVAKIAREHNLLLIVDNTFLTPYFQNPLDLGADIVIHSGTKYLCGHNDTLAGFLVVADQTLSEKLRFLYKTLAVRMEKQQESAMKIAQWLCGRPKIPKVHYVGLPSHPDYEISKRQARGFGAMISFEVDSEKTAVQLLERVKLALYAESLGGVETLVTYPMLQTHADVPAEEREAKGINERLLRLSVGLEFADDIIEDLAQALA